MDSFYVVLIKEKEKRKWKKEEKKRKKTVDLVTVSVFQLICLSALIRRLLSYGFCAFYTLNKHSPIPILFLPQHQPSSTVNAHLLLSPPNIQRC